MMKLNLLILLLFINFFQLYSQVPIETSTARLVEKHEIEIGPSFEYVNSPDGKEASMQITVNYGLSNRIELDIEPAIYKSVTTVEEPNAHGFGDVNVALAYLVLHEQKNVPAIALEGSIKIPTAKNPLLGTQKFDYNLLFIASKKFGKLDMHINLGYTFIGEPTEMQLRNIIGASLAGQFEISEKVELAAEFLANTSSFLKETDDGRRINPQVIPGEVAVFTGMGYNLKENLELAAAIGYNNRKAFIFHTGLNFSF